MKKYFLSIIIIGLIISCRKNKIDPNSGFDPNKPSFRVGTKWVYHSTAYLPDGTITYEQDQHNQVLSDTLINVVKYYIATNDNYFTNKNDGYYVYDRITKQENLIYKYPVFYLDVY